VLIGTPSVTRSAVFEQMDNDQIAELDGGALVGAPLLEKTASINPPVLAGVVVGQVVDVRAERRARSVIIDLPRGKETGATRFAGSVKLDLLKKRLHSRPRPMPTSLSLEQRQMRKLTVVVAHRYASAMGVRAAGLDRQSFVKIFTAMIHRESNFNRKAVSPAGARGLGQLMPATARELGVCDVFSARENLEGSARYLTAMLERFQSPVLALAAYNAGPNAVKRFRGVPPYSETVQYVTDIVHSANQSDPTEPIITALTDVNNAYIESLRIGDDLLWNHDLNKPSFGNCSRV
jgi:hypothetical protein